MNKPTVVLDFDGVIHSYTSGWKGIDVIPDPPVPGIKEAIDELNKYYDVVVVSTRCRESNGFQAMSKWMKKYDINIKVFSKDKPPAIAYIDDRAITFDGHPETLLRKVKEFKPWNK